MSGINIDMLVDDLRPVRPVKSSVAYLLTIMLTGGIALLIAGTIGVRPDVMAADPATIVIVRSGTLLLLGFSTLQALALSARPGIGTQNSGWKWILAVAGLFPLATFFSWMQEKPIFFAAATSPSAVWCVGVSLSSALVVGAALTLWLRRGAPVSIDRSSWLVGLSSGAFGTFCYNLFCSSESVEYVGMWYVLSVALCAAAGRIIVPRFIRW